MDNKGYTFTPLAFLLIIPLIIIAVSFGDIVNEINSISSIAIGGDVTYSTAQNVIAAMDKGASDAGRRSAYNATRLIIDRNGTFFDTPSDSVKSKTYIRNNTVDIMNDYMLETCNSLEEQTGREIYINNQLVTHNTQFQILKYDDVTLSQSDPYGFYVTIREGIPIKVVQKNQIYEGKTPSISAYVSIQGLEDPYIWENTKHRNSTIIYKYPNYYVSPLSGSIDYHFADQAGQYGSAYVLHNLWECLSGYGNPSNFTRSYYFPDSHGLTFFDRLENKIPATSSGPDSAKMSTFILEDPLWDTHTNKNASCVDNEYFADKSGTHILITHSGNTQELRKPNLNGQPTGILFYLSPTYKGYLGLNDTYSF